MHAPAGPHAPRRTLSPPPTYSRGQQGAALGIAGTPSHTDASTTVPATTKSLIHRLRHAVTLQEATLRNLREPLTGGGTHGHSLPGRSTAPHSTNVSSHGNTSSVATPSVFHVASKRRWCAEFADATCRATAQRSERSIDECMATVNECLSQFEAEAAGVGRSFLERYLGDEAAGDDADPSERSFRTQSPGALGECCSTEGSGVMEATLPCDAPTMCCSGDSAPTNATAAAAAGGPPFPCEWATGAQVSHGAFLTITLLDCEDNVALSAASKEQQSHMIVLGMQMLLLPSVLVYVAPRCVVQWRGRILLVAAQPLLTGEARSAMDHPELGVVMSTVSDACRLSRYFAPKSADDCTEEVLVAGHPTASTRLGRDGRWYLDQLTSLFPHFPPARGAVISRRHMMHLRQEALMCKACRHPLSPAAFLVYGTRDSTTHNAAVRERTQELCHTSLRQAARALNATHNTRHDSTLWDGVGLAKQLHNDGLNVGMLGLLLSCVQGPSMKFVFSEMVARVSRDYLRSCMSKRVELDDTVKVISEFMAELSQVERFHAVWQDELFQRTTKKFAAYGSFFAEHATHPPFGLLDREYLMRRIPQLLGVQFASGVSSSGSSAFHFPVKQLTVLVKRFLLPTATMEALQAVATTEQAVFVSDAAVVGKSVLQWPPSYVRSSIVLLQQARLFGAKGHGMSSAAVAALGDECLKRFTDDMTRFLIPMGSIVPALMPEYVAAQVHVAAILRHAAQSATDAGAAAVTASAVELARSALSALQSNKQRSGSPSTKLTSSDDMSDGAPNTLLVLAEAELARCLALQGHPTEALQRLDSAFQLAAASGARRGGVATATSTPRYGGTGVVRSATSSVEVQALSLPSNSNYIPPAALTMGGAAQTTGMQRSASAGAAQQRTTKMSVSIIGEEDDGLVDMRPMLGGPSFEGIAIGQSGGASTTMMPDADTRGFSRSHDAISLSDLDPQDPGHPFLRQTASSLGSGFNALAATLATELAALYEATGHMVEAEAPYRYALQATRALLGDDHPSVSIVSNNLAIHLMSLQKFKEAEELFRMDLAQCEALYGSMHPNVSSTLNNLACVLDCMQRPEEGEPLLLRDVEITKASDGPEHPNVATAQNNLGATYLRRGMLDEAAAMLSSALTIRESAFGRDSAPVAEVLFNLGVVYRRMPNREQDALAAWSRCYTIQRATNDATHSAAATSMLLRVMEALSVLCEVLGDYERSEALMEEAFLIKQR